MALRGLAAPRTRRRRWLLLAHALRHRRCMRRGRRVLSAGPGGALLWSWSRRSLRPAPAMSYGPLDPYRPGPSPPPRDFGGIIQTCSANVQRIAQYSECAWARGKGTARQRPVRSAERGSRLAGGAGGTPLGVPRRGSPRGPARAAAPGRCRAGVPACQQRALPGAGAPLPRGRGQAAAGRWASSSVGCDYQLGCCRGRGQRRFGCGICVRCSELRCSPADPNPSDSPGQSPAPDSALAAFGEALQCKQGPDVVPRLAQGIWEKLLLQRFLKADVHVPISSPPCWPSSAAKCSPAPQML